MAKARNHALRSSGRATQATSHAARVRPCSIGSSTFRCGTAFLVLAAVVGLAAVGGAVAALSRHRRLPDTTPVQVQINTVAPALAPEEVEQQITFPIEQAISGLPGLESVRSVSKFGLSQVVVTFEDGTDIYFARQLVNERLATVELPAGIGRPQMGPVATGPGRGLPLRRHRRRATTSPSCARSTTGSSSPSCAPSPASPRSTVGAATRSSTRSASIPNRLIKHGLTFDEVVRGRRGEQPQRRRRQHPRRTRGCCWSTAWAARPTSSRSRTSSSPPRTACRSASATWPTCRSATRSAAAP